jgi:hypothetical protein
VVESCLCGNLDMTLKNDSRVCGAIQYKIDQQLLKKVREITDEQVYGGYRNHKKTNVHDVKTKTV